MKSTVGAIEAEGLRRDLPERVSRIVQSQVVTDMHTHVYGPAFGASPNSTGMLLWGIDELLRYHYLIAEVFRVVPATEFPYEKFWAMSRTEQADHIWKNLFVRRTPISEACCGVLTTLSRLGLDPNESTLDPYRRWFSQQKADAYLDTAMRLANVDCLVMTNEVFSDHEHALWLNHPEVGSDPRFKAVLRIDLLLSDWPAAVAVLRSWDFQVSEDFSGQTVVETKRFLHEWIDRMKPVYVAMSLDPVFRYPAPDRPASDRMIRDILMPVLAEHGLAWAMMIGSKRVVNPALRDAGDVGQKGDPLSVAGLCRDFPANRFLVTMLSREDQHELCVIARKFGNLMPFGCWWFLNNPSLIEQITRMRLELLGTGFVAQHSDARILDQIIYKWHHFRRVLAKVLTDKYLDLMDAGYRVTEEYIQRDVKLLLRDNFRNFVGI